MIPSCADSAADRVGEALGGANVAKQAGRKSSAKGLVEHRGRVVIGSVAHNAHRYHLNLALIHVGFVDLVIARLGGGGWRDLSFCKRPLGPRLEGFALTRFHFGRVEVADYSKDDVVWVNVFAVPLDEILTRNRRHRFVLGNSR